MAGIRFKSFLLLIGAAMIFAPPADADVRSAREAMAAGNMKAGIAELEGLAKGGNVQAQVMLGELYASGRGVTEDLTVASDWFEKAAEAGSLTAQLSLAGILAQNQEYDVAAKWYAKAADQGDGGAMTQLAIMHLRGIGVPADAQKGLDLFRRAAEMGDPETQMRFGLVLMQGLGGAPDPDAGRAWLTRSANQGYGPAQLQLGSLYVQGRGVEPDLIEAYRWFHLAAMKGDDQAIQVIEAMTEDMTPEQIAEAKKRADSWRPGAVK